MQGLPEAEASGEVFKYSCQARSRLESSLELRLEGLGKLTGAETFTHDFTIPASKQSALKNALQLVPQFTSVTDPTQPLRYAMSMHLTILAHMTMLCRLSFRHLHMRQIRLFCLFAGVCCWLHPQLFAHASELLLSFQHGLLESGLHQSSRIWYSCAAAMRHSCFVHC